MSEENLIRQCAPTLAGIKTGTIFPVKFRELPVLTAEIRSLNRILVPKGLRLLPLRYRDGAAVPVPPIGPAAGPEGPSGGGPAGGRRVRRQEQRGMRGPAGPALSGRRRLPS